MRILFLQLLLVFCPVCFGQVISSENYRIVYTGRTLGYYRIPDLQPTSPALACPSGGGEPAQVQAFRNQLASVPGPKILVATGDNFGPDLGARTLCNSRGELIPKQRSAWPGSDNVASFFRMLGFTAMVPGKLDFYYGPERLRLVARYLANNAAPGHPVQMLGANLTIETSVIHPPAETPKPAPSTNYSTVLGRGTRFHFPKLLLPYTREFDIDEGASVSTTVTSSSGAVQSQALTARDLNTPGERNIPIPRFRFAWFCKGELGDKVQISPACRPLVIGSPVGTTLPLRMPDDWPRYPSHGSPLSGGTPAYICASSVGSDHHGSFL